MSVLGADHWGESWNWGLSLIVLTIAIHATGVVSMMLLLRVVNVRAKSMSLRLRNAFAILIGQICAAGLLLALLHGLEAGLWAAAYCWVDALPSWTEAIFYSVDSITTRGAAKATLEARWQMMGALEAMDGVLLFGISTAFIFATIQVFWPTIIADRDPN